MHTVLILEGVTYLIRLNPRKSSEIQDFINNITIYIVVLLIRLYHTVEFRNIPIPSGNT